MGIGDAPQLKIGKNPIHHQYCQYYLNYLRVKNEKINYWFGCNWNPLMVFCIDMCLNKKNKYSTNQAGYQRSSVFRFIAPNSINRYHWNTEIWSEKISIKWFNKCHNCVESVVLSQQQTNIDIHLNGRTWIVERKSDDEIRKKNCKLFRNLSLAGASFSENKNISIDVQF